MKRRILLAFLLATSLLLSPFSRLVFATTWSTPVNVSNLAGNSSTPKIVVDNVGTIHAVWCGDTLGSLDIFYTSKPVGGSWSTPVNISKGHCQTPTLAISPDNTLHVAWEDQIPGFNIFYASKPSGGSWTTPLNVSNCGLCDTYNPNLAIASDGGLHLTWYDAGTQRPYYATKLVGGTWSTPIQIQNDTPGQLAWTSMTIDSSDNLHLVAIKQDHNGTDQNVYYLTKPNGGVWSTPTLVSDCTGADNCSYPVIAAHGNTLHLLWNRTSTWFYGFEVYYTTKVGNGPWSTPVNLSNNTGTSFVYSGGLAADSFGNVHVVWQDDTSSNREVLYSELVGGSWSTPLNLSNTITESYYPAIAVGGNGYAHVVWGEVLGPGNGEIYYSTNAPPNQPPTASAGGPYNVPEGGSVSLNGSGSDPDGDPITFAWDLDNNGTFETPGQNVTFSAAGLDGPSSRTVVLQVCDDKGACTTSSTTVNITNVAPTVGTITAPTSPLPVNSAVNTSATFTDPGVLDTHTAVWNWGDGTTSAGSVDELNHIVTGTHTYTVAGVYTLQLTVTDKDGGTGQNSFNYVVIFDSTAGFVTGAGAIDSPAGAYPQDPTLSGRANFGFSVKYVAGDTAPNGGSQFKFRLADINFASTSYQWLVISGTKATFKGVGTNNGVGNYTFLVSTIDGSPDRYRIKITDNNTNTVFYDNEMESSETADPTTPLMVGNIVIH